MSMKKTVNVLMTKMRNTRMKTKAKSKRKAKTTDSLAFELDGAVYIVETTNGKVTRSPLDGEVVLKTLVCVLEKALDEYK